ncbi:MAG: adenosylhomocysteinase [Candidatus Aenigmatarchaeota archaeon]
MYKVKDISLASQGRLKVEWSEQRMPVLMGIRRKFEKTKPLKGFTVGICLHVTKETAVLVETLVAGGARVAITGCNPLSTQDDISAYLAKKNINIFAWRGETKEEYYENINKVLDFKPEFTVDDGGDLVFTVHKDRKELISNIIGGCEETTTGIQRLIAMKNENKLRYPIIDVNNAKTKHLFDNRYGTGQSTIDGIMRATSVLIAGKNFVVAGYGWCGKGIAMRARGMGANVIVTEVDPLKALEAAMDGFRVMPMDVAAELGDIFVTATGNKDIIIGDHIKKMKNGAILANAGHFNVEIKLSDLEKESVEKKRIRENCEQYELKNGKRIYLLAEGRLVNLACAEGHPSEVMDMSFANQALSIKYLIENRLEPGIYPVPHEVDNMIAYLKLKTLGIKIDELTESQKKYLSSWEDGT